MGDHHAKKQKRDGARKTFAVSWSDDRLRWLLGEAAKRGRPEEPEKLSQAQFNHWAPLIAAEEGEPEPPKATAVYTRLNKARRENGRKAKSWAELVADSLKGDAVRRQSVETRAAADLNFDEAAIVHSLRRVAHILGHPPTKDEYTTIYQRLIKEEQARKRQGLLSLVLLTANQIEVAAGGWGKALALAGLEPQPVVSVKSYSPLLLLAHFYEVKPGMPLGVKTLARHASELGIWIKAMSAAELAMLKEEFIAKRAAEGRSTPESGPLAEEALSAEEIEALIAPAQRVRLRGYWTLDLAVTALVEYLIECELEGANPRQAHYRAKARGRDWPTQKQLTNLANANDLGGFQDLIAEARQQLKDQRKAAA